MLAWLITAFSLVAEIVGLISIGLEKTPINMMCFLFIHLSACICFMVSSVLLLPQRFKTICISEKLFFFFK